MNGPPFVGMSYQITTRKADAQRSIGMVLRRTESGSGKPATQFFLEQFPGLTSFVSIGAEIRGGIFTGSRCFVAAGATLYELDSAGSATSRGALLTSTGPVDFAWGVSQICLVDGPNGYAFALASNSFGQITDPDFYGSYRVWFLDNYFLFIRPDSQQAYWSELDDASNLDALNFFSAESSPDLLVSHLVDHEDWLLFGIYTTEVFNDTGGESTFEKSKGSTLEVGCAAKYSPQQIDNSVLWIGRDRNGEGIVYRMVGRQPQRISTSVVEEALQGSTDLSAATAFCFQYDGLSFYCINAPGLTSTWAYEIASGSWSELCELVSGQLVPWRARCHIYAFGRHLIGAANGVIYELDKTKSTNAGDVLYRERTSPHYAAQSFERTAFGRFKLDCTVGEANQGEDPQVELTWSDDGGKTYPHPWFSRSLGMVGKYGEQVQWNQTGSGTDRVWKLRCTDDVKFNIINVSIE